MKNIALFILFMIVGYASSAYAQTDCDDGQIRMPEVFMKWENFRIASTA
jgi:hypothetical protein